MIGKVRFDSIRSDWYAANTVLPRLVVRALETKTPLRFVGFPAQWIPVLAHYGFEYLEPRPPISYVPFFSDLDFETIGRLANAAKRAGASRSLLESVVALDPIIADFVYIVDHKLAERDQVDPAVDGTNLLNTWHSFSRPEIVQLQARMSGHIARADAFLLLPCARHRPYESSRTHQRLRSDLSKIEDLPKHLESVVVTALGVVPAAYWHHPLVMSYDAGAVDLWRVFQLLRSFFTINKAALIIDCLSFKPYSEMLQLLHEIGTIPAPRRPVRVRWRSFHVKLK